MAESMVVVIRSSVRSAPAELLLPVLTATAMILVSSRRLVSDGDPLWSIATGRWIVLHQAVPHFDPFSWTALGSPWVAHEWAWDTLLYVFTHLMGYYGLMTLTWLAFAVFSVALWFLCREDGRNAPVTVTVYAFAVIFAAPSLVARPQMASYALFAVFLYVLICRPRQRWILPLLTVAWANLHASVVLGVLMIALEAGVRLVLERDRSWLPVAGAGFLASLVNPNGLGLWKYTIWMATNPWNRQISEWRPPNFAEPGMLYMYALIFLTALAALLLRIKGIKGRPVMWKSRRPLILAVYFVTFSCQALTEVRYFPYLTIIWAVVMVRLLPDGPVRNSIKAGFILVALAAAGYGIVRFPPRNLDANLAPAVAPAGAVQYIEVHGLTSHLFNYYTWGGYLIYKGIPVFIDGRDDIYLAGVFQDYQAAYNAGADTVLIKYGVRTVLVPNNAPLTGKLNSEAGKWRVVYRDADSTVFEAAGPPH